MYNRIQSERLIIYLQGQILGMILGLFYLFYFICLAIRIDRENVAITLDPNTFVPLSLASCITIPTFT